MIDEILASLGMDATLWIVSDADPRQLRFELDAGYPEAFAWRYVQPGPDPRRMDILQRRADAGTYPGRHAISPVDRQHG